MKGKKGSGSRMREGSGGVTKGKREGRSQVKGERVAEGGELGAEDFSLASGPLSTKFSVSLDACRFKI